MARIRSIKPQAWVSQQQIWEHEYSIYVIQERRKGPVKIGVAGHPFRRLSALQGGNPRVISLRAVYVGTRADCRWIEGAVLFRFSGRAVRGEWLDVPLEEVLAELDTFEYEA